jgi:hypothetical protein
VTVVVNQAVLAPDDPALPQPVSLRETVFQPAVWIGRQQEAGFGAVDKHVLTRAEQVVAQLIAAGDPISA